ncbi:MAG: hypothetical protein JW394_0204 [Nitrospira sp.]|nr:hypothetical protein [Nitrospira sp.]
MLILSPLHGTPPRIVLPSAHVSSYACSMPRAAPVVPNSTLAPASTHNKCKPPDTPTSYTLTPRLSRTTLR